MNTLEEIVRIEAHVDYQAAVLTAQELEPEAAERCLREGKEDLDCLAEKTAAIRDPDRGERGEYFSKLCEIEARTDLKRGLLTTKYITDPDERVQAVLSVARAAMTA